MKRRFTTRDQLSIMLFLSIISLNGASARDCQLTKKRRENKSVTLPTRYSISTGRSINWAATYRWN